MNSRYRKTYDAVFDQPTRANIPWVDVEALFRHLGATITEGNGSRVRIVLNGVRQVFHRPLPEKATDKHNR
jgi:hypothetical protein